MQRVREKELDLLIGKRLRTLRRAYGYTCEELAKKLSISYQRLARQEKGDRIGASRLMAIAEIMGCPITDFFEGLVEFTTQDYEHETGGTYVRLQALEGLRGIKDQKVKSAINNLLVALKEEENSNFDDFDDLEPAEAVN